MYKKTLKNVRFESLRRVLYSRLQDRKERGVEMTFGATIKELRQKKRNNADDAY